jgi:hypothetical protein
MIKESLPNPTLRLVKEAGSGGPGIRTLEEHHCPLAVFKADVQCRSEVAFVPSRNGAASRQRRVVSSRPIILDSSRGAAATCCRYRGDGFNRRDCRTSNGASSLCCQHQRLKELSDPLKQVVLTQVSPADE